MTQYTREQMFKKLENADKAGDAEAAKFFASEIRRMDSVGTKPTQKGSVSDIATQARIAQQKGLGEWNDNRQREVGAKYRREHNNNQELSNYSDEQIGERATLAQAIPAVATFAVPGGMIGKGVLRAAGAGGALGAVEESFQQALEKMLLGTEFDGEKVGKEGVTGALTGAAVNAIPSVLRPLAHAAIAGKNKTKMSIADSMLRKDMIDGEKVGAVQKGMGLSGAPTPDLSQVTNNPILRAFDQLQKGSYFRGGDSKRMHDKYIDWVEDQMASGGIGPSEGKRFIKTIKKNTGDIGIGNNAMLDVGLFLTGGPLANATKVGLAETSATLSPKLANKILNGSSYDAQKYGKSVQRNLEKDAKLSIGEAKIRRATDRNDSSLNGRTAYSVGADSKRIKLLNKTKQSNKAIPTSIALQELVQSLFGE